MGVISEKKFIKGMDVSTLLELEQLGAKYYDSDGDERNLLAILQEYGTNAVRLRLWNNPYSKDGEPYGQGRTTWKPSWSWQGGRKTGGWTCC